MEMFRKGPRERTADPIYSERCNFMLSEGVDDAERNTGSLTFVPLSLVYLPLLAMTSSQLLCYNPGSL